MFQIIFWGEAILQFTVHYLTRENLLCQLKFSTFSLLTHFCLSPLFSSNMSLSMFWLLRRSLTTILQRIFEWRKESCWVVSLISNSSFTLEDIIKMEPIAKFTHLIVNMCLLTLSRLGHFGLLSHCAQLHLHKMALFFKNWYLWLLKSKNNIFYTKIIFFRNGKL